ncbi:MAG: hypothetical protein H6Q46_417 [Deltaproteobacteria bacterium]|nr:hypothetical protein [Deltaproteobacteria bacterium]
MKKVIKKYYKLVIGYVFIVLGILGLFLPFLQGILFLVIGAMILVKESPTFYKLKEKIKAKYPKFYYAIKSKIKKF